MVNANPIRVHLVLYGYDFILQFLWKLSNPIDLFIFDYLYSCNKSF
jgi:hypothetical protein